MNLIKLSIFNLYRHKRLYRSCTISIIISVSLILFFYSLYNGASFIINNEVNKYYNFKQISILSNILQAETNKDFFSTDDVENLKKIENLKSITINNRTSVKIKSCFIDNTDVFPPDYLIGSNVNFDSFSWAQLESCKYDDKSFNEIIAGKNFTKGDTNVCIIDEASVKMLGIEKPSDIVGKKLLLVLDDERELYINVIGVYSQKLGINPQIDIEGNSLYYTEDGKLDISSESIILSYDVVQKINREFQTSESKNTYSNITISMPDLKSVIRVYNELSSKYFNQIQCESENINKTLDYLKLFSAIFIFLGALLLILSAFNLHLTAIMILEKRKKWFAIQSIVGFRKYQLLLCYLFEIIFAVLRGFIISIIIVVMLCLIASCFIQQMYSKFISVNVFAFLPSSTVLFSLFGSIILFIIVISAGLSSKINKLDVIKILS